MELVLISIMSQAWNKDSEKKSLFHVPLKLEVVIFKLKFLFQIEQFFSNFICSFKLYKLVPSASGEMWLSSKDGKCPHVKICLQS